MKLFHNIAEARLPSRQRIDEALQFLNCIPDDWFILLTVLFLLFALWEAQDIIKLFHFLTDH